MNPGNWPPDSRNNEFMNFNKVFKVFDTVMSVIDATKEQPSPPAKSGDPQAPVPSFGDQIEMRLTNVVISALKEAFNRDEARLELERTHLEEQRRRAEETMRIELRKQAADRELSRLRLLGVAGMVAWIACMLLLVLRSSAPTTRGLLIAAAILSLSSLGSSFMAQSRIAVYALEKDRPLNTTAGTVSLSLLLGALALAALSVLV
jgi:hypothetical protein